MNNSTLLKFKNWFSEYVDAFDSSNSDIQQNINVKREHIEYVCVAIRNIAESINLSVPDLNIAEAIGLFHDIDCIDNYFDAVRARRCVITRIGSTNL